MDHLDILENKSVHILREAYSELGNLCMLWSIGKDSTVLLWLARKAFFGHVPIPLVHIDTHHKIPEMIEYRDRLAAEWNLDMIYGENTDALDRKETFPDGKVSHIDCCMKLKTEALTNTLNGNWPRYRFNHSRGCFMKRTPTARRIQALLWAPGQMKREAAPKSAISHQGIKTMTGMWETSPRNSGTSTRRTGRRAPMSGYTRCWTGRSWMSGNISDARISLLYRCTSIREMEPATALLAVHLVQPRWSLRRKTCRRSLMS